MRNFSQLSGLISRHLWSVPLMAGLLHSGVAAAAEVQIRPSAGGAQLTVGSEATAPLVLDLGVVAQGEEVPFTLLLAPPASGEEVIESLTAGCMCTVIDFRPDILMPSRPLNYSGKLKIADVPQIGPVKRTFSIKTDKRVIVVELHATVSSKSVAVFQPVDFQVGTGQGKLEIVQAIAPSIHIQKLSVDPAWTSQGVAFTVDTQADGSQRLRATLDVVVLRGYLKSRSLVTPWTHRGRIALSFTEKDKEAASAVMSEKLGLSIEYGGEITISRDCLDFGVINGARSFSSGIVLHADSDRLKKIAVTAPSFIHCTSDQTGADERAFIFELVPAEISPWQSGFQKAVLTVDAGDGIPQRIPVRYFAAAAPLLSLP